MAVHNFNKLEGLLSVALIVLALAGSASASPQAVVKAGEYLVAIKGKVDFDSVAQIAAQSAITVRKLSANLLLIRDEGELKVQNLNQIGGLSIVDLDRSGKSECNKRGKLEALGLNSGLITFCEPNFVYYSDGTDPLSTQLWGIEKTNSKQAWGISRGSGVKVAVIDTGVDTTHPDLAANIDSEGYNFVDDSSDPTDDNGHGTHVAGTIGAIEGNGVGVVGVAPNAKILPLKFLDSSGAGTTSDAVRAVDYAVSHGAKVINASWGGGGFSQGLFDAISKANKAGVVFAAAAGNESEDNDASGHYPSGYELPNVISVAATDSNNRLAYFSNYGKVMVDIGAPGVSILSTYPGNHYAKMSGTSMATPHISGALALLLSKANTASPAELIDRLMATSSQVSGLKVASGGVGDFYAAVSQPSPGDGDGRGETPIPAPTIPGSGGRGGDQTPAQPTLKFSNFTGGSGRQIFSVGERFTATVKAGNLAGNAVEVFLKLKAKKKSITCSLSSKNIDAASKTLRMRGTLSLAGSVKGLIDDITLIVKGSAAEAKSRKKVEKEGTTRSTKSLNEADLETSCSRIKAKFRVS